MDTTSAQPSPSDLLRHIAAGREEYARSAPERDRELLLDEANAFRNAARVLDDPTARPDGLLPSWYAWPPSAADAAAAAALAGGLS